MESNDCFFSQEQSASGTEGRKGGLYLRGEVPVIWSWWRTCLARNPWRQENMVALLRMWIDTLLSCPSQLSVDHHSSDGERVKVDEPR